MKSVVRSDFTIKAVVGFPRKPGLKMCHVTLLKRLIHMQYF